MLESHHRHAACVRREIECTLCCVVLTSLAERKKKTRCVCVCLCNGNESESLANEKNVLRIDIHNMCECARMAEQEPQNG